MKTVPTCTERLSMQHYLDPTARAAADCIKPSTDTVLPSGFKVVSPGEDDSCDSGHCLIQIVARCSSVSGDHLLQHDGLLFLARLSTCAMHLVERPAQLLTAGVGLYLRAFNTSTHPSPLLQRGSFGSGT